MKHATIKQVRALDNSRAKSKKTNRKTVAQQRPTGLPARRLLTPKEAATILGVSEATLAVWRCNKRYDLPFVRIGRLIKYHSDSIESAMRRGVSATT